MAGIERVREVTRRVAARRRVPRRLQLELAADVSRECALIIDEQLEITLRAAGLIPVDMGIGLSDGNFLDR